MIPPPVSFSSCSGTPVTMFRSRPTWDLGKPRSRSSDPGDPRRPGLADSQFSRLHVASRSGSIVGRSRSRILVLHFDNDPTATCTYKGIVTAISRLDASGVPMSSELHLLNHWR